MVGVTVRRVRVAVPLLLLPVLLGCQERPAREEAAVPFVFRALNLRQQDAQGRPAWQLTSPEARYDISRKLAQARQLRGTIFSGGQPLYRLSASSGTVLGDGALIQLEGQTSLERLGPQPLLVRARRVRWYPRERRMVLDQRPSVRERDLEMRADRADFLIDQDTLMLRGHPQLWQRPLPAAAGPAAAIVVTVSEADWSPRSGILLARGPVRAVRRQRPGSPPQTLTAPLLRGNTLERVLVLQAPVRFSDPAGGAQLLAGDTSIDLGRERVVSQRPFTGAVRQLQLAGEGFELLQAQTLAVIAPGCVARQPGEQLSAERCSWNWRTQAIQAQGSVRLERRANGLVTRADQLEGRLGSDGQAVFSSPGQRVNTQLRLREGSAGTGTGTGTPRPAAGQPPIPW